MSNEKRNRKDRDRERGSESVMKSSLRKYYSWTQIVSDFKY